MIAKKDLEHGTYYQGNCRNATEARWNKSKEVFTYWRTKFGYEFLEDIKHPEDELYYDVFKVEKKLDQPTKEIPL